MLTTVAATTAQVGLASTPGNHTLPVSGLRRFVVTARSPIGGAIKPARFHDRGAALHVARVLQQAGFDVVVRHAEDETCDILDTGGERHE